MLRNGRCHLPRNIHGGNILKDLRLSIMNMNTWKNLLRNHLLYVFFQVPEARQSKEKATSSISSEPSRAPEFVPTETSMPSNVQSGGGGLFESSGNRVLDMLLDVPLNMTIELGRTQMSIRRILEMGPGSIIELDRFAGEPVDLLVNNKVVARGEVVVVDENFGIRIVSLVTPEERIKFLKCISTC